MEQLLLIFYQLPMGFVAQAFVVGSLVCLLLLHRSREKRWVRWGLWVLWSLAVLCILAATLLLRHTGTPVAPKLTLLHSYLEYWTQGRTEMLRTSFMNVVLFFPAGFLTAELLPRRWKAGWRLAVVVFGFFALSIGIELVQYRFALGEPDVDDVLHNTLGAALGTAPRALEKRLFGEK